MAVRKVEIPGLGEVSLYKRKGIRSMRLSVGHDGEIRLSMPSWTPYAAGIAFIKNNVKWITDHKAPDSAPFSNNMRIGKAHTLVFLNDKNILKPTTRITLNQSRVLIPIDMPIGASAAQAAAKKVALRTLKNEAETLLPKRLNVLADMYGFSYSQIKIKQLKSRWGSCNNLKQITLSFYLMQLPWELIDYVILHELTHTKVLAHGPDFWDELTKHLPNAKVLRKQVNTYKPVIYTNI